MGAAAEGWRRRRGRRRRPSARPCRLLPPLFTRGSTRRARPRRRRAAAPELQAETKRREAAEQKLKEVEEVRRRVADAGAPGGDGAARRGSPGAAGSSAPGAVAGAGVGLLRGTLRARRRRRPPRRPQPTTRCAPRRGAIGLRAHRAVASTSGCSASSRTRSAREGEGDRRLRHGGRPRDQGEPQRRAPRIVQQCECLLGHAEGERRGGSGY